MKRLALVAALLTFGGGVAALAQTPSDAGSGARPYVQFGIVRFGETAPGATVGDDLAPGAPATAMFTSKESLCANTFGGTGRTPADDARTVVVLSADLVDQKDGAYSIRLTSRRLRSAGQTSPEPPLEQIVSLRDGDRVVVDWLRDFNPPPGCNTAAVALEAKLLVRLDPSVAQTVYQADLWFVHRDETGREWTEHVTTNVNGALDMPFLFNDVTFALPKLDPGQDAFTAFVRLTGTLRARARTDGLLDLDITTARAGGLLLPSTPPGIRGSSTRKSITVRADETTAIEIPQPGSGFVMTALRIGEKMPGSGTIGARPAGPGIQLAGMPKVFISNGRFVFNSGEFFKDHVTRLLVRVRKTR